MGWANDYPLNDRVFDETCDEPAEAGELVTQHQCT